MGRPRLKLVRQPPPPVTVEIVPVANPDPVLLRRALLVLADLADPPKLPRPR